MLRVSQALWSKLNWFYRRFVTMNKTCVYCYTFETERGGEVIASMFCNFKKILILILSQKEKNFKLRVLTMQIDRTKLYVKTGRIKHIRKSFPSRQYTFFPYHLAMSKILKLRFDMLPHPHNSVDFPPSYIHYFLNLIFFFLYNYFLLVKKSRPLLTTVLEVSNIATSWIASKMLNVAVNDPLGDYVE